jgi:hypothetical protein
MAEYAFADRVIEAVTAAGRDLVWTLAAIGPASFWTRRRAHEAAVHLADAQLTAGRDVDLAPEVDLGPEIAARTA